MGSRPAIKGKQWPSLALISLLPVTGHYFAKIQGMIIPVLIKPVVDVEVEESRFHDLLVDNPAFIVQGALANDGSGHHLARLGGEVALLKFIDIPTRLGSAQGQLFFEVIVQGEADGEFIALADDFISVAAEADSNNQDGPVPYAACDGPADG